MTTVTQLKEKLSNNHNGKKTGTSSTTSNIKNHLLKILRRKLTRTHLDIGLRTMASKSSSGNQSWSSL